MVVDGVDELGEGHLRGETLVAEEEVQYRCRRRVTAADVSQEEDTDQREVKIRVPHLDDSV